MKGDSLGDRMKGYEACFDYKLPPRIPMMIRVDGRSFHTLVKRWKCTKPFDATLNKYMIHTAVELCKEISGTKLAYLQSDEITIVATDDKTKTTQAWFDKRINKVVSSASAIATQAFNGLTVSSGIELDRIAELIEAHALLNTIQYPAMFDARAWILPDYEIVNNLIWRQQDAARNSIQMLSRSLYSHKSLIGVNTADMHELCFAKGANWNNLDTWSKRGICIVPTKVKIQSVDSTIFRSRWCPDMDIPVFTENPEYIKELLTTEM